LLRGTGYLARATRLIHHPSPATRRHLTTWALPRLVVGTGALPTPNHTSSHKHVM